jgi:5-methyltetrahydropteroyltriglutamate--homocysteine methyltransferase
MTTATNLGWPRFGPKRELKRALEARWAGKTSEADLLAVARDLRRDAWRLQSRLGIATPPSNDFSLYDHVLDQAVALGAVPARFAPRGGGASLDGVFAMARGAEGLPAMEMTKWFDTNYHYIVPELERGMRFSASPAKAVAEWREAKDLGIATRPVLVGPVSFLLLSKSKDPARAPIDFLPDVLPAYEALLAALAGAGADWIQVDEPFLALDLDPAAKAAFPTAYARLSGAAKGARLLVASYFEGLRDNLGLATALPVDGLHVDLVRDPRGLDALLRATPRRTTLSLGVVDGRNVWRSDLAGALALVTRATKAVGRDRVLVAPSCSLLHVPLDADLEDGLDPEVRSWLAFAKQKVEEIAAIAAAADERTGTSPAFEASSAAVRARAASSAAHDPRVRARLAALGEADRRRRSPYAVRRTAQRARRPLPALPTTTIGSFPQTEDVRRARAEHAAGKRTTEDYEAFLRARIEDVIRRQEALGIDVLVHGEFERNDMVEHFGERLVGFAITKHGWVQSYGSRLVKPPILHGDVRRAAPMTVAWSKHAQSLTKRPVKGMLTGPVTILQWSFVRDDQPRADTCRQVALAIRDEVADLERAGLSVVQIDEPAIREGLPLRRADRAEYLRWAVDAFRLASSGVADETQIHTHMCYSEFGEILDAIAGLDADVVSIEASRSGMDLLKELDGLRRTNEVGPGVWDIHSPRVPGVAEMEELLRRSLAAIPADRLWANPDCGLKTRRWEEVEPSLKNLVEAARRVRAEVDRPSA